MGAAKPVRWLGGLGEQAEARFRYWWRTNLAGFCYASDVDLVAFRYVGDRPIPTAGFEVTVSDPRRALERPSVRAVQELLYRAGVPLYIVQPFPAFVRLLRAGTNEGPVLHLRWDELQALIENELYGKRWATPVEGGPARP